MLMFRQCFDPESSTYSYLLAAPTTHEAVLIDPVQGQTERDIRLVKELGVRLRWTLETHIHADHVTGGSALRAALGSKIAISKASGANGADRLLEHGDTITFGGRALQMRATPGHTPGCAAFVLDDESMVFTGDALMIRGCGRTDFQQGSPATLFRSVREQLFSLPDSCLVYPGHDYKGLSCSTIAEEKRHNPRLGLHMDVTGFSQIMDDLGLAYPKMIDVAVPANLRCGEQR
ncbi:MAG: MBL fold metallo-hydrolase [Gammaproteobacteria bacterium]|nr:MBL fold metallo-hydrolase [Gammaproteobacteria bacterium]